MSHRTFHTYICSYRISISSCILFFKMQDLNTGNRRGVCDNILFLAYEECARGYRQGPKDSILIYRGRVGREEVDQSVGCSQGRHEKCARNTRERNTSDGTNTAKHALPQVVDETLEWCPLVARHFVRDFNLPSLGLRALLCCLSPRASKQSFWYKLPRLPTATVN